MFLSHLTNKELLSGNTPKGICRGVGVSLKSHAVKYLLCASASTSDHDFSVSTNAVEEVGDRIRLSKIRPLYPRNCARIFIGRPVYAYDGAYLGVVRDLLIEDMIATHLVTETAVYPITSLLACLDAVILKREQPFPIGQRIPAPFLSLSNGKKEGVVTKPLLRAAIEQGKLVRLTFAILSAIK